MTPLNLDSPSSYLLLVWTKKHTKSAHSADNGDHSGTHFDVLMGCDAVVWGCDVVVWWCEDVVMG